MKKLIILTLVTGLLSYGVLDSAGTNSTIYPVKDWETMEAERIIAIEAKKLFQLKEFDRFLNDIGHRESSNDYTVTNKWGYMGRYQFGKSTLRGLGFKWTRKEFLNTPQFQEEAMLALLLHNKEKLQTYIDLFDGKEVNGVLITESGILAAAHLGGQGSVRRYFKNGRVFKDANGTKITSYLHKFSGYDIKLK
jgi:hypothetical protein